MADFILSCESTVDLPYSYVSGRNIPVIFYSYIVDGVSYVDDMGRNEDALPLFYDFIKQGKLIKIQRKQRKSLDEPSLV